MEQSQRSSFAPCLCGDPECPLCFPRASSEPSPDPEAPQTTKEPAGIGESEAVELYFGKVYDPETGEEIAEIETGAEFTQEWVEDSVKRIAYAEARKAGAVATLTRALETSEDTFGPEVRRFARLAEYLRAIYEPHLARFARANLPSGKRSVKTPFGALAFRTKPGRLKVVEPEALGECLYLAGYQDAITVKSIAITGVPNFELCKEIRRAVSFALGESTVVLAFDLEQLREELLNAAISAGMIERIPDEETFTVKV